MELDGFESACGLGWFGVERQLSRKQTPKAVAFAGSTKLIMAARGKPERRAQDY